MKKLTCAFVLATSLTPAYVTEASINGGKFMFCSDDMGNQRPHTLSLSAIKYDNGKYRAKFGTHVPSKGPHSAFKDLGLDNETHGFEIYVNGEKTYNHLKYKYFTVLIHEDAKKAEFRIRTRFDDITNIIRSTVVTCDLS
jgi:hypothetical protein